MMLSFLWPEKIEISDLDSALGIHCVRIFILEFAVENLTLSVRTLGICWIKFIESIIT